MSEITISTSNLKTTRNARIDGALYEVRRIGAGDKLDISRLSNKLLAESRKAMNVKSKIKALNDLGEDEQTKILDEVSKAMDSVVKTQLELEACYVPLFVAKDANGDAAKLVHAVGVDGINTVLQQIFADKNAEDSTDGND